MLDRILRTIVPDKFLRKTEEGEAKTALVLKFSREQRRIAEARMIQSYKQAGVEIQRHPWRD